MLFDCMVMISTTLGFAAGACFSLQAVSNDEVHIRKLMQTKSVGLNVLNLNIFLGYFILMMSKVCLHQIMTGFQCFWNLSMVIEEYDFVNYFL